MRASGRLTLPRSTRHFDKCPDGARSGGSFRGEAANGDVSLRPRGSKMTPCRHLSALACRRARSRLNGLPSTAGRPVDVQFELPNGATVTPRVPPRSMNCCTAPEGFGLLDELVDASAPIRLAFRNDHAGTLRNRT
jgi:hypothetical protein